MTISRRCVVGLLGSVIALGCGHDNEDDSRAGECAAADSAVGTDAVVDDAAIEGTATRDAPGPLVKTVFVIVMENKNLVQLTGSALAPYINLRLSAIGAQATQYYNPPMNHPSEPNYVWLEAGDSLGIKDDGDPSVNARSTTDHLAAYLDKAGTSWRAYEEDIDGNVCPLTPIAEYGPKHDPFVFFTDVTGQNNPADPYCIEHIRPFTEFAGDLARNTVARYNFITPNLCNDMHDCAVQIGDGWLEATISSIMESPAYASSAIFVTWDEADGGDGPIGLFVVSPFAKAGYSNAIHYDHSSLLKTVQEIFGITPLLRHAGDASVSDLSDLFSAFP